MSPTLFEKKYLIHELLGKGGMGEVYAATHVISRAEVAIKLIPRGRATRELAARLLKESAAMGALVHPGIVRLHDAGVTDEGLVYLVMERVHGEPLRRLLSAAVSAGERIDPRAVLYIMAQVAEAMHFAHVKGILHRDLKPENIMVGAGSRATVLDFGLAKHDKGTPRGQVGASTDPARVLGTPSYMAPEQVRGRPVDARTDVYAMGVILYEALANRRPYGEDSSAPVTEIMAHHAYSEPAPLGDLVPDCPERIARIVATCLAKSPEQRFATMGDLARELRAALRELVRPRVSGVPPLAFGEEEQPPSFAQPRRIAVGAAPAPALPTEALSASYRPASSLPFSASAPSASAVPRLAGTAPLPEGFRGAAPLPFLVPSAPEKRGLGHTQRMPASSASGAPAGERVSVPGAGVSGTPASPRPALQRMGNGAQEQARLAQPTRRRRGALMVLALLGGVLLLASAAVILGLRARRAEGAPPAELSAPSAKGSASAPPIAASAAPSAEEPLPEIAAPVPSPEPSSSAAPPLDGDADAGSPLPAPRPPPVASTRPARRSTPGADAKVPVAAPVPPPVQNHPLFDFKP
jgi:serine/threonine-protein kinase